MKTLAASLTVATVALAKETLKVSESGIRRIHPIVEAMPCNICAVETTDTQVCLAYSGNAIAGWKWEQVFSDNTLTPDIIDGYYDLKFKVYTQLTGAAEVTSNLSTVVNSTVNGSFQPFKVGGYL
jgi:hypothetical protein